MKKNRRRNHPHRSKKTRNTSTSAAAKKNNWDPMDNWCLLCKHWEQWRKNTKDKKAFVRFIKQLIKCIISILLHRVLGK